MRATTPFLLLALLGAASAARQLRYETSKPTGPLVTYGASYQGKNVAYGRAGAIYDSDDKKKNDNPSDDYVKVDAEGFAVGKYPKVKATVERGIEGPVKVAEQGLPVGTVVDVTTAQALATDAFGKPKASYASTAIDGKLVKETELVNGEKVTLTANSDLSISQSGEKSPSSAKATLTYTSRDTSDLPFLTVDGTVDALDNGNPVVSKKDITLDTEITSP